MYTTPPMCFLPWCWVYALVFSALGSFISCIIFAKPVIPLPEHIRQRFSSPVHICMHIQHQMHTSDKYSIRQRYVFGKHQRYVFSKKCIAFFLQFVYNTFCSGRLLCGRLQRFQNRMPLTQLSLAACLIWELEHQNGSTLRNVAYSPVFPQ